jgi:hypothetical protein
MMLQLNRKYATELMPKLYANELRKPKVKVEHPKTKQVVAVEIKPRHVGRLQSAAEVEIIGNRK